MTALGKFTKPLQLIACALVAWSPVPIWAAEPEISARWLPMQSAPGGLVLVHVMLDGSPAIALVDTGYAGVVVNARFAREKGFRTRRLGQAYSVGGEQAFEAADGIKLAIGERDFPAGTMQVADFSSMENALGSRFDVVLGTSLIARTGLEVDYDQGRARFQPPAAAAAGAVVALHYNPETSRLTLDGSTMRPSLTPLLLDTGSDEALSISQDTYEAVRTKAVAVTDHAVAGGGGLELRKLLTLPSVTIGKATRERVTVGVEPPNGFLARNGFAGSVGAAFLQNFDFGIDAQHGQLRLVARQTRPAPEVKTTVGVQATYETDRIHVVHAMANSPAQKAGIADGEDICAVNDQAISNGWSDSPMRSWGTRPPGIVYRVRMCSGRTVTLTSSSFY